MSSDIRDLLDHLLNYDSFDKCKIDFSFSLFFRIAEI